MQQAGSALVASSILPSCQRISNRRYLQGSTSAMKNCSTACQPGGCGASLMTCIETELEDRKTSNKCSAEQQFRMNSYKPGANSRRVVGVKLE